MRVDLMLALRSKYGLVHVPSRARVERWIQGTRAAISAGLPPERAGLQTAFAVFPYEARELHLPDSPSVEEMIDRVENSDPL